MSAYRFMTLLVLSSIALMFAFGATMSMNEDNMGQMPDCPFSHGEALCQMSVFEHLARFQQAFTSVPVKLLVFIFLILLIRPLFNNKIAVPYQRIGLLSLKSTQKSDSLFDGFLLALSDGIVQPKLYA